MRIFVSYTLRDGVLSPDRLASLASSLAPFSSPYVDVLHNRSEDPQRHVLRQLMACELLLACKTPGFLESPWVRLELSLAAAGALPVVAVTIEPYQAERGCLETTVLSALTSHRVTRVERSNNGLKLTKPAMAKEGAVFAALARC